MVKVRTSTPFEIIRVEWKRNGGYWNNFVEYRTKKGYAERWKTKSNHASIKTFLAAARKDLTALKVKSDRIGAMQRARKMSTKINEADAYNPLKVELAAENRWANITYKAYDQQTPKMITIYKGDGYSGKFIDELDAYKEALKYLAKLKKKADARREQWAKEQEKEQTT